MKGKLTHVYRIPEWSLYRLDLECGHRLHFVVPHSLIIPHVRLFVSTTDEWTAYDPCGQGCLCVYLIGRWYSEVGIHHLPTREGEVKDVEVKIPSGGGGESEG